MSKATEAVGLNKPDGKKVGHCEGCAAAHCAWCCKPRGLPHAGASWRASPGPVAGPVPPFSKLAPKRPAFPSPRPPGHGPRPRCAPRLAPQGPTTVADVNAAVGAVLEKGKAFVAKGRAAAKKATPKKAVAAKATPKKAAPSPAATPKAKAKATPPVKKALKRVASKKVGKTPTK